MFAASTKRIRSAKIQTMDLKAGNPCVPATAARTRFTPAAEPAIWTALDVESLLGEQQVCDADSLRRFLARWLENGVAQIDLPVIRWAHECATRNDANGLVELDRLVSSLPLPSALRRASLRVGRSQLRQLAPLKGHKCVARYQAAVEAGHAEGHNPIVYGVFLHLFSIPLREGLLAYGFQTVRGFASAAAAALVLDPSQGQSIAADVCSQLPLRVEASLLLKREQLVPADGSSPSASSGRSNPGHS